MDEKKKINMTMLSLEEYLEMLKQKLQHILQLIEDPHPQLYG